MEVTNLTLIYELQVEGGCYIDVVSWVKHGTCTAWTCTACTCTCNCMYMYIMHMLHVQHVTCTAWYMLARHVTDAYCTRTPMTDQIKTVLGSNYWQWKWNEGGMYLLGCSSSSTILGFTFLTDSWRRLLNCFRNLWSMFGFTCWSRLIEMTGWDRTQHNQRVRKEAKVKGHMEWNVQWCHDFTHWEDTSWSNNNTNSKEKTNNMIWKWCLKND